MEQKKSFFEKAMLFLGIAVCGAVSTYLAVLFAGIDLLLAGVVFTLICDGALTIWLRYKWYALLLHVLWACLFWGMTCYTHVLSIDINWQWYLLWGLFAFRVVVLQPFYLLRMSQSKK